MILHRRLSSPFLLASWWALLAVLGACEDTGTQRRAADGAGTTATDNPATGDTASPIGTTGTGADGPTDGGPLGGAGAACTEDADCAPGTTCQDGTCTPGGECGATEFTISKIEPNLVVILDRSCSMKGSRWTTAVDAVSTVVQRHAADVRFGLALYPDNLGTGENDWERACRMDPSGAITVPVGPDAADTIVQTLHDSLASSSPLSPGNGACQTPTYNAIAQAALDPALDAPDRPSYLMLVTDGEATCLNPKVGGDIAAINALLTQLREERGIATFVVGFGSDVSPEDMRSHALAGGTATSDALGYYQADDPDALVAALDTITGTVIRCDYALGETAPAGEQLYVFFNDEQQIPQDPLREDGWDYDPETNAVTFFGSACDTIRSQGQDLDIDVVFGCPKPIIE